MSHRLQVLIDEDLNAELGKAAQQSRISKGEWVRRALSEALPKANGRTPADPLAKLVDLNGPSSDLEQMLAEMEAGRR